LKQRRRWKGIRPRFKQSSIAVPGGRNIGTWILPKLTAYNAGMTDRRSRTAPWLAASAVIILSHIPFSLYGGTHTVRVTGIHTVGPFDSESDSQRLALLQARSLAVAQALSILEESAEVKPFRLGREELSAYSRSLLRFEEYPGQLLHTGTTTIRSVEVKATVDPFRLAGHLRSLFQHERAKAELTRAMDKIVVYRKEIATDTEILSTMTSRDQARSVLDHRRERLKFIEVEERLAATWTVLAGLRESSAPPASAPPRSIGNAEEHWKKATALIEEGAYDEAIAEFRAALQLMPKMAVAHVGLGAALQRKGDLDGAISQYRLFLDQHPDDAGVHMNLGTALQKQGDLDGAIAEYRLALRHRPDYALGHFNLGTALATKSLTDEALTEYRTAIRLDPGLVHAYFDLGSLLKDKDQPKEAAEAFREYVRRAPSTPANQLWIEKAEAFLADRYEKRRLERREPR
jgi:tetratricopeptide (TPR) repeat protein